MLCNHPQMRKEHAAKQGVLNLGSNHKTSICWAPSICQAWVLEARIQGLHLSLWLCDLGSGGLRVKREDYCKWSENSMKKALGRHPEYCAAHKILFQILILFLILAKFTTLNIPQKLHLDLKYNSVQCVFFLTDWCEVRQWGREAPQLLVLYILICVACLYEHDFFWL